jgi:hypothetical protein
MTLSKSDTQHNNFMLSFIMLSHVLYIFMLNDIIMSVFMLNIVMLSVVVLKGLEPT